MGLAVVASVPVEKRSDAVEAMAPALTEPLSQSKLSSSAASGASPRTSSSTTSTATTTFDGTTILTSSPGTVHNELDQQQQQQQQTQQQLEQFVNAPEHHLQHSVPADVSETVVVTSTTTTLPEENILPGGAGGGGQGTATMSMLMGSSDGVGSTTVDDIQNNNSGDTGLKLDTDANRDLIELALEQLHQDANMGGGGNGNETPAVVDSMTVSNVVDMASVTAHPSMPANVLQLPGQHPIGDLMPMELPPAQMIVSQGNFPDAQQQQQMPGGGGFMNIPIQDSSQSSSSLTGMGGISGSNELGMQLKESK